MIVQYRGEWRDYMGMGLRALALGPPIPEEFRERVTKGTPIELRRPDGTILRTRVDCLLHSYPGPQIGLSRLILIHEVPRGTEVWLAEADSGPPVTEATAGAGVRGKAAHGREQSFLRFSPNLPPPSSVVLREGEPKWGSPTRTTS